MLKKSALVAMTIVIACAAVYRLGGGRLARDGSGIWPRLFSSAANYDALEEDRARQRQRPIPSTNAADVPPRAPVAAPTRGPVDHGSESPLVSEASEGPAPALFATVQRSGDWSDFRGPNRDGRYHGEIRDEWPREGIPPVWRQPIGLGYASFVAAEGRAFTIEQRRHEEVVSAYDVGTGRELWTHGWEAEFTEWQGGDGPRATPTYHDSRLYALGALGELRCLDARTGVLIWRRNILEDSGAVNLEWGMAAAPLVVDDKLIVLPGGPRGRSVAAYNRVSGEPIWTALDDQQAYTSPMLVTLAGVRQLLIVSATRAAGLTIEDGTLLWEYPWETQVGINVAQPLILGGDRVFLSAGYGHGAAVFEIARADGRFSIRTIWQNTRMKNKFTSSVLYEGHIYGLDETILACVDAATGELKWKGGRYGYGQILLAGDRVVVLTEDGDLAIVRATPERHEELARFPAIEGKTWNHPIVTGGRLIVRNLREMAAFDVRP